MQPFTVQGASVPAEVKSLSEATAATAATTAAFAHTSSASAPAAPVAPVAHTSTLNKILLSILTMGSILTPQFVHSTHGTALAGAIEEGLLAVTEILAGIKPAQ